MRRTLDPKAEAICVAQREQFEKFCEAVTKFGRTNNVLSIGTAISLLTEIALREIEEGEDGQEGGEADSI